MNDPLTALLICMMITIMPIAFAQDLSENQQETQQTSESNEQDFDAPKINYFTIYPETTSTQPVQFNYQASDYGSTEHFRYCSGIKKVDFTTETGQIIATKTGEQQNCLIEESFEYAPTEEGRQTICATAYDYTNKKSDEKCAELQIQKSAPEIQKTEFFDDKGTLNYISKDGVQLNLKIFFEDASTIDFGQTKINVEKITGTKDDWRRAYRSEANTITASDINVPPQNFECKITTSITDIFGNNAEKELACELSADKTQPVPETITTDLEDLEGAYLVSTKGTTKIIATFAETGIGFERKKKVYLDLYDISRQSKQQPDKCERKINNGEAKWQCIWETTATTKPGPYTITLLADSEDDYGNKITKEIKQNIDVTNNNLEIIDLQYAPANPTTTDELTIMTSIHADTPLPNIVVDTQEISTNKKPATAKCETDGEALRCTAKIKNLKTTNQEQHITVTASDGKGNTKQITQKIEILESAQTTQDFFKFESARIQPRSGIDRKTATITEYPIFANINWRPPANAKGLQIVSQSINCDQKYLTANPELTEETSMHPTLFLQMTTDVSDIQENFLKITCTASIVTKKGKQLFKQPEIKTFTLKIPLYNNPLGSIDETVQKKMDEADKQIEVFNKKVKEWSNINSALGKIVGISQTIAQTDAMMGIVTAAVWGLAVALDAMFPGTGTAIWASYCSPYVAATWVSKAFIWSPSYVPILQSYTPLKMAAFIYSCQLCRHTGKLDIPFLGATGDIVAHVNLGNLVQGKQTLVKSKVMKEWDPKKSIHVAQNCYCPNAIEYNLRKEQQLKCIYRNCIKEHTTKGLPLTSCDQTYKEQNCVYIDSAAWKLAGGAELAALMQKMLADLIRNTPIAASGLAWAVLFDPWVSVLGGALWTNMEIACDLPPLSGGYIVPIASVWAGIQEMAETDFFNGNQFNWDQYNAELKGTDYCAKQE